MAYEFECFQDGCTFLIRADTMTEIERIVSRHAKEEHDLEIDTETIEKETAQV